MDYVSDQGGCEEGPKELGAAAGDEGEGDHFCVVSFCEFGVLKFLIVEVEGCGYREVRFISRFYVVEDSGDSQRKRGAQCGGVSVIVSRTSTGVRSVARMTSFPAKR